MTYVTFVDVDTGATYRTDTDLNLIVEKVTVGEPPVRRHTKTIPGADGKLDYSKCFGRTIYDNRAIKIYAGKTIVDRFAQGSRIYQALHGHTMRITLSGDPAHYYKGMVEVGEWTRDAGIGHVVISCDCEPYKLKQAVTTATLDLTTSYKSLNLPNEARWVIPSITVTAPTTLRWGGSTYALSAGTYRLPEIRLAAGENMLKAKLTSSESGSITVEYQEASL